MEQSICLKCNKNLKWEEQFISSEGDFCKDCYNEELYKNTTLLGESKLYDRRERPFDIITAKITQILSSGVVEDSRDTYQERADALLSFEIEPGVTLKDVFEFYLKYRNYIQGNCHVCNKVIFNSNDSRIVDYSTGKDIYFCCNDCYIKQNCIKV